MVPLKDYNPIKINPFVTYGIIAINVLVFIYELALQSHGLSQFYDQWAVVPQQLSQSFQTGFSQPAWLEWDTLITAQFLHAGVLHLAGNMLYLWIFGNNLEEEFGHTKFLLFYLLCGVFASLAQWVVEPTSPIPSLGASGAIAGVMGAYVFKFPQVRILTLIPLGIFWTTFQIPALFFLGFWFVEQALNGFITLDVAATVGYQGGVAYWAHAAGFVMGALLGWVLGLFNKTPIDISES